MIIFYAQSEDSEKHYIFEMPLTELKNCMLEIETNSKEDIENLFSTLETELKGSIGGSTSVKHHDFFYDKMFFANHFDILYLIFCMH